MSWSNEASQAQPSCILYQNGGTTLIDIPRSIAAAQGTSQSPCCQNIISCPPITSPFPSNEPKSTAAKASLEARNLVAAHDELNLCCVSEALSDLQNAYTRDWCLPRSVLPQDSATGSKRKASDLHRNARVDFHVPEPSIQPMQHLAAADSANHQLYELRWDAHAHPSDDSTPSNCSPDRIGPWTHHLANHSAHPRTLQILSEHHQADSFIIPPSASLYLGDCSDSRPFHSAVRAEAQRLNTSPLFDCIIMDPPWPNASVTRARKNKKSGYQTSPTVWDIRQLIFETDVNVLLSKGGLMAIWITNNPRVRELVLGEDGLFDSWDVKLEEEWLWIKTTNTGDPVTPLQSLWRKPYEVLLLGRKRDLNSEGNDETSEVKRRVMAGVPDLHSRKPCLKDLIAPLMPDSNDYRALEVFARYLVAGWWSWGNEVLKFNHQQCWAS